jgi:lipid-A-disaccharide synthase
MLDTARLIHLKLPESQFIILRSPSVEENIFKKMAACYKIPLCMLSDMTYDGLAASDFAMVASGTATLETAILAVPMVIMYKISFLTWAFLRTMIKIPYIGLVNVVKQERFVPEFIQYDAKPAKIAEYILKTAADAEEVQRIRRGLSSISGILGEKGASIRAAKIVSGFLSQNTKGGR